MDEGTFRNYFLSYASIDFVWMLLKCIHTNVDIWFSIKRREKLYNLIYGTFLIPLNSSSPLSPHTHCTNVMNLVGTVRTLEQVIYKFVKFAS